MGKKMKQLKVVEVKQVTCYEMQLLTRDASRHVSVWIQVFFS